MVKDDLLLVEWEVWNTVLNLTLNRQNNNQSSFTQYQQDYQKAIDLSKITLVGLNTPENATAHWLITQHLEGIQGQQKNKDAVTEACQMHYEDVVSCGITPRMAVKYNLPAILQQCPKLSENVKPNETLTQIVFDRHQTLLK